MAPREQRAKREEILKSAATEFAAKGYDKANINDISTNAGMGKGTVYLYYKTKKDLYLAVVETIVDQFNDMSEHILALQIPPIEKIAMVVETFFSLEKSLLPFLKIWARHQFQSDPVFPGEVAEIFKNLQQPLCDIIRDGVESGEFSTSNPTAIGFFILHWIVMLIPGLQPAYAVPTIKREERFPFLMEVVQKVLQRTGK